MALTDKLSAIGAAIREKTGSTELMTLDAMPAAIAGIQTGGGDFNTTIEWDGNSGTGRYMFTNNATILNQFPQINVVTSSERPALGAMFAYDISWTDLSKITLTLPNIYDMQTVFSNANKITNLPNFIVAEQSSDSPSLQQCFQNCTKLQAVPSSAFYLRDAEGNITETPAFEKTTSLRYCFNSCYSLRDASLMRNIKELDTTSYTNGADIYTNCYVLDELYYPIGGLWLTATSSSLYTNNTPLAKYCHRAKDVLFQTNEDGTPLTTSTWGNATINLTYNVGYASSSNASYITDYSGIGTDKQVTDDASYQALKNDPDWWTADVAYSRYNHDSAVRTIATLPDVSAGTATYTIKFTGASGEKTDGGAINTLTEDEIAVATAKGWTVEFV